MSDNVVFSAVRATAANCGLRLAETNRKHGMACVIISIVACAHGVTDKTPSKTLFLSKAFPDTEGKPDANFIRRWPLAKAAYAAMSDTVKATIRDADTVTKAEKAAETALQAHMTALGVTTLDGYKDVCHFSGAEEMAAAKALADKAAADAAAETAEREAERAANKAALDAAIQAEAEANPVPEAEPVALENVTAAGDTLATLPKAAPVAAPDRLAMVKDATALLTDDELAELAAYIYLLQTDRKVKAA